MDILMALIGGGLDFAVTTGTVLWSPPLLGWSLVWIIGLIVASFVAPFFAFHKVRTERENSKLIIEELRNERPVISVELPDSHEQSWLLGEYSLIVSNRGGTATVSAQVKITEGLDDVKAYDHDTFTALWEGDTNTVQLMQGQRVRMYLIGPDPSQPTSPPYFSQWRIRRWDDASRRASHLETTSWLTFGPTPPPELTFEVTISSHPSDPSGPTIRTYHLDRQGLREIGQALSAGRLGDVH